MGIVEDRLSKELAPSRKDNELVARAACDLLGIPYTTRYDATIALAKLAAAAPAQEALNAHVEAHTPF